MKLDYFSLLSPAPIYLPGAGGILSPKLDAISRIGMQNYQQYLAVLLLDTQSYLAALGLTKKFETLTKEEKSLTDIFNMLTSNEQSTSMLQNALNFFMEEEIRFSSQQNCFLAYRENTVTGTINKENYPLVRSCICRRNCINPGANADLSKVKSKKAQDILKKLSKGKAAKAKQAQSDRNMELGNIISAVANRSHSLNILNIWDLTVFQVWDCFSRLSNNSIYDIQSMSVAAWGNKDKVFDISAWFKRMDTDNESLTGFDY